MLNINPKITKKQTAQIKFQLKTGQARKIIDPLTGEEVAIEGTITNVQYKNGIGIYTVTRPDQSVWKDYVDLETMTYMYAKKISVVNMKAPLYRLYNPRSGDHLYTTSEAEKNMALSFGYVDEGVTGYLASTQETGTEPLYRLYNPNNGTHFYTMNAGERDILIRAGLRDEGVVGYAFKTQLPGTQPLYRLYNPITGTHIYTMSSGERDTLLRMGLRDEGVAAYMAISPSEIVLT